MARQLFDMAGFFGDIHRTACRAQRKKSYKDRSNEQTVNGESMLKVFVVALWILMLAQLLFPVLATRIRDRFQVHGVAMRSSPGWSWTVMSGFWSEARDLQRRIQDQEVKKLLALKSAWWILVLASFAGTISLW
jgi:hypothetical protein